MAETMAETMKRFSPAEARAPGALTLSEVTALLRTGPDQQGHELRIQWIRHSSAGELAEILNDLLNGVSGRRTVCCRPPVRRSPLEAIVEYFLGGFRKRVQMVPGRKTSPV